MLYLLPCIVQLSISLFTSNFKTPNFNQKIVQSIVNLQKVTIFEQTIFEQTIFEQTIFEQTIFEQTVFETNYF
jgi:hypothetical protein